MDIVRLFVVRRVLDTQASSDSTYSAVLASSNLHLHTISRVLVKVLCVAAFGAHLIYITRLYYAPDIENLSKQV